MYGNFISRHFANQSGIIILVNWPRAPIAELSNWLRRVLWDRILRGRDHWTWLWNSIGVKWLWRILQSSGRHHVNMMSNMMKPFIVQFSSQRCFAFIRPHTHLVYRSISCHFANPEPQRCFWLLPNRGGWSSTDSGSLFDSWATSVLVGFNMDRAGGSDWRNNKFHRSIVYFRYFRT